MEDDSLTSMTSELNKRTSLQSMEIKIIVTESQL